MTTALPGAAPAQAPVTHSPTMWRSTKAVAWRGILRTLRFPAIIIQSFFFPGFFFVVYVGLYRAVTDLPGFPTDSVANWYLPFMLLQAAAFGGTGAGFATAVDIDNGFFDRLLLAPGRRMAILFGTVGLALVRTYVVAGCVFLLGLAFGARPTDVLGLPLLFLAVTTVSIMGSCFSLGLIYTVKDQRIAPLFSIGIFMVLFVSTAQVPLDLTTGWLTTAARWNPMTQILELARTGFVDGGVTWAETWPGLVAVVLGVALFGGLAARALHRFID